MSKLKLPSMAVPEMQPEGPPVVLVAPVVAPVVAEPVVVALVAAVSSAASLELPQAVRAPGRKASAANAVLKFVVRFTVLVTFEV